MPEGQVMPTSTAKKPITPALFVERRKGSRRVQHDRCAKLEVDLYHRKRRTSKDRRALQRSPIEDITAYYEAQITVLEPSVQ